MPLAARFGKGGEPLKQGPQPRFEIRKPGDLPAQRTETRGRGVPRPSDTGDTRLTRWRLPQFSADEEVT